MTYLISFVIQVASCRPLASVAIVSARQHSALRLQQRNRLAGLEMAKNAARAATQKPEMLGVFELAAIHRQSARIAHLRSPDE